MAEKQETGLSKVVGGVFDLAKPLATFDLQNDAVGQVANTAIDQTTSGITTSLMEDKPKKGKKEPEKKEPEKKEPEEPTAEPTPEPEEAPKSSAPKQSVIEGSFTDVSKPTTSTDAQKAIEAPAPKPVAKGRDSVTAGGTISQSGSTRSQLTAPAPVRTPSPQKANASKAKVRSSMVNPGLSSYRIHH
jgi:outer membrane biosynthesis protein TonB